MATSVVGVMKMGIIVPRAGLEPTSLAFRASVLLLHHVGFLYVIAIPMPTCLYSSLPQRSVHITTILYIIYDNKYLAIRKSGMFQ